MNGSRIAAVLILWMAAVVCAEPRGDFFVAPGGLDTNAGTIDAPFGSLQRAQQAVRQRIAAGLKSDVVVLVRQGTYMLTEPLVFGPQDSATADHAVRYAAFPGEKVVVSGGRKTAGWRKAEDRLWTAVVPQLAQAEGRGLLAPRNLFVDGRRAVRARTPNIDAEPNCRQLTAVEFSKDGSRFALRPPAEMLAAWQNPGDVEVMIAGNWAINRKRVQSIDAETGTVILAPPHRHGPDYIFPAAGRWCYFENARELLDQPGEWYLERQSGTLTYWPRDGEEMSRAEVVVPLAGALVRVAGTPQQPVRNLHFDGFCFAHTDWQLPPEGYMGIQACHYGQSEKPGRRWRQIPAAIEFAYAQDCSVENGTVAHLGGCGIGLSDGCRNCLVRGNHVFDVSANGIMVGGPNIEAEVPRGNRIDNNHVHACGVEYYGAIGIWVGFAQKTEVTHNLIHDLPYSGISVGWEWNDQPTACRENLVAFNHVHNVMNRLCDGGCIYTLGLQPGTVIRGNHLHDVHRSSMAQGAPNNGMFIDQGSKGYLFDRNVIYDTSAELVRFNQCQRDWHTWRDNYFGDDAVKEEGAKQIIAEAGLEPPYREQAKADRE